jgi:hypothetical protein
LFLIAALALLCFSELGACAEHSDTPAPVHPDLIIVRRFATPRRIVTLDPSLGFSLHRGQSGVPPARRAASVARATAFIVADTITQQLRDMGYDESELVGQALEEVFCAAAPGNVGVTPS